MSHSSTSVQSCPQDWWPLLDHRFDPDVAEPADWPQLHAHLQSCSSCRDEACAIDPTLALQRLPEVQVDAAEIAAMKQAVATLRRGREVEIESATSAPVARLREIRRSARHSKWAAVAAAAAAVVLLVIGGGWTERALQSSELPSSEFQSAAFQSADLQASEMNAGERVEIVQDPRWILQDTSTVALVAEDGPIVESIDPGSTVYTLAAQPESTRAAVAWVIDPTVELRPPQW